jgi:hypothetical protein
MDFDIPKARGRPRQRQPSRRCVVNSGFGRRHWTTTTSGHPSVLHERLVHGEADLRHPPRRPEPLPGMPGRPCGRGALGGQQAGDQQLWRGDRFPDRGSFATMASNPHGVPCHLHLKIWVMVRYQKYSNRGIRAPPRHRRRAAGDPRRGRAEPAVGAGGRGADPTASGRTIERWEPRWSQRSLASSAKRRRNRAAASGVARTVTPLRDQAVPFCVDGRRGSAWISC